MPIIYEDLTFEELHGRLEEADAQEAEASDIRKCVDAEFTRREGSLTVRDEDFWNFVHGQKLVLIRAERNSFVLVHEHTRHRITPYKQTLRGLVHLVRHSKKEIIYALTLPTETD